MKSKTKICILITLGFIFTMVTGGIFAASDNSAETKIAIETSMENRLTKVLKEITGSEKLVVIVNTDIYTEKEKKEIKLIKPQDEKKKNVLPGVPVKESIGERKIEDLLAPLDLGETRTLIKKISVTVMLDKNVSGATVELVKKISSGLIGINAERGDLLSVERIDFSKGKFLWETLLYPPNVFWVIGIMLGGLFTIVTVLLLFNPFRNFARNFISTASAYVAQQKERAAAETDVFGARGAEQIITPETAAETARKGAEGEEKSPFWFIDGNSEKELLDLLKTEMPENIAVVLNYTARNVASRIFASLPPEVQSAVALRFATVKQLDPDVVKSLEQKIKDRLDFSLKGESSLVSFLDYLDKPSQQKIISQIELRNNELAKNIRGSVFSFDDIALLSDRSIQSLVRSVNTPVFAQILKTMPAEFSDAAINALPEGARKIIRQEMELGRPLAGSRLDEEKRKIVDVIKKMKNEGLIEMRSLVTAPKAVTPAPESVKPASVTPKPSPAAPIPGQSPFVTPKPAAAPAAKPTVIPASPVSKPAAVPVSPTIKPAAPAAPTSPIIKPAAPAPTPAPSTIPSKLADKTQVMPPPSKTTGVEPAKKSSEDLWSRPPGSVQK